MVEPGGPGVVPLFVTRKFPPSVGGMQTLAADVWAALDQAAGDGRRPALLAHGGSNAALPAFLLRLVPRLVRTARSGAVDVVLVGDVLLAAVLAPALRALRVPYAVMAMGKDVVWSFPGYRRLAGAALRRAPVVVAISSATADAVRAVGGPQVQPRVLRLGVRLPTETRDPAGARAALRERFGVHDDEAVLVLLGRLVPRKGALWFVEQVVPLLPGTVRVLVAGGGQDAERLALAVKRDALAPRVELLGAVEPELKDLLMGGADVFVQPNVPVPGDMEGFGLVAVEAAARGALVLAADLEGLRDAVVDGVTGRLVRAGDAAEWAAALSAAVDDLAGTHASAARYAAAARETFSLAAMAAGLQAALADASRSGRAPTSPRRAARRRPT